MTLTIITASFNSEKSIANTFDSIMEQPCQGIEYIVVDGGSTDKTVSIIQHYEQKFKEKGVDFKWVSELDTGIYNAWNKGLKLADGEWIAFLGSDDSYVKGALKIYTEVIKENQQVDFVTAKAKMLSNGKLIREFGEAWHWKVFRREMKILHAGGFLKRDYLRDYGFFNETYKITGDYELLLRKREELKVCYIDKFLVEMGSEGVSSSKIWESLKEAKRARVETGKVNRLLGTLQLLFVYSKIKIKHWLL